MDLEEANGLRNRATHLNPNIGAFAIATDHASLFDCLFYKLLNYRSGAYGE
jgi:hypothetical protein